GRDQANARTGWRVPRIRDRVDLLLLEVRNSRVLYAPLLVRSVAGYGRVITVLVEAFAVCRKCKGKARALGLFLENAHEEHDTSAGAIHDRTGIEGAGRADKIDLRRPDDRVAGESLERRNHDLFRSGNMGCSPVSLTLRESGQNFVERKVGYRCD